MIPNFLSPVMPSRWGKDNSVLSFLGIKKEETFLFFWIFIWNRSQRLNLIYWFDFTSPTFNPRNDFWLALEQISQMRIYLIELSLINH